MHRAHTAVTSFLLAAALFTGLLAPFSLPAPVQAQTRPLPELLLEAPAGARAAAPASQAAQRTRLVALNPAALEHAGQPSPAQPYRLGLTLFPELSFTAELTGRQPAPSGGYVLSGSLADQPGSAVTLSVYGGDLAGSVTLLEGGLPVRYEISPAGGPHRVERIDQAAFPAELDVVPPQLAADLPSEQPSPELVEDGSQIDVMVVYDAAARDQMGGTAGSLARINLAIAESNQGFANSGVAQRFALAHAAEVQYSEPPEAPSGSSQALANWNTMLKQLTNPSDSVIDEVHGLRDAYAADLTVMLVRDPAYCGLAWVMNRTSSPAANYGFAVVAASCATGYYSFAHELGHNMGSIHDRPSTSAGSGYYEYSYGYQDPGRAFRTIMAYNCPNGGCPRINHWSNPDVLWNGLSTGVAAGQPNSANNALSLNNNAAIVANFRVRQPQVPNQPGQPVGLPVSATSLSLTWTDQSTNETGFQVRRSVNGGEFQTLADLPANTTSYLDETITRGSSYLYQVVAFNAAGSSAPSQSNLVTCAKPPAPQNLATAGLTPAQILLTWTDTPDESGYRLEWAPAPEGPWTLVSDTIPADTVSLIDLNRVQQGEYYYRLQARSPFDESEPTSPVPVRPPAVAIYIPCARNH